MLVWTSQVKGEEVRSRHCIWDAFLKIEPTRHSLPEGMWEMKEREVVGNS